MMNKFKIFTTKWQHRWKYHECSDKLILELQNFFHVSIHKNLRTIHWILYCYWISAYTKWKKFTLVKNQMYIYKNSLTMKQQPFASMILARLSNNTTGPETCLSKQSLNSRASDSHKVQLMILPLCHIKNELFIHLTFKTDLGFNFCK